MTPTSAERCSKLRVMMARTRSANHATKNTDTGTAVIGIDVMRMMAVIKASGGDTRVKTTTVKTEIAESSKTIADTAHTTTAVEVHHTLALLLGDTMTKTEDIAAAVDGTQMLAQDHVPHTVNLRIVSGATGQDLQPPAHLHDATTIDHLNLATHTAEHHHHHVLLSILPL